MHNFCDWLARQGKTRSTIKQNKNYALKYGHILDTGDAAELLTLSPRNRHHALVALANLSKYCGCYRQFVYIRQNYNLKWTSANDSLQTLQRFFNPEMSLESMFERIRAMIRVLPEHMGKIIKFACLIGLRPSEVCESVRLLNTLGSIDQRVYYNPERQCLEHFRFPQIFLRQTKKAYISFVTREMLSGIATLGPRTPTWNAIRLTCQRRGIPCDMRYCRKIHATHLYQSGIPVEIIDALQGRTPANIFAKWYYRPSLDYKQKVLDAVDKLKQEIDDIGNIVGK